MSGYLGAEWVFSSCWLAVEQSAQVQDDQVAKIVKMVGVARSVKALVICEHNSHTLS